MLCLETNQVGGPVEPIPILQAWGVRGQSDGIGIPLGSEEVDALPDSAEHGGVWYVDSLRVGEVEDPGRCVVLEHRVFADEDLNVREVCGGEPVVVEVEILHKVAGLLVGRQQRVHVLAQYECEYEYEYEYEYVDCAEPRPEQGLLTT
jgi:hypothetical protein